MVERTSAVVLACRWQCFNVKNVTSMRCVIPSGSLQRCDYVLLRTLGSSLRSLAVDNLHHAAKLETGLKVGDIGQLTMPRNIYESPPVSHT